MRRFDWRLGLGCALLGGLGLWACGTTPNGTTSTTGTGGGASTSTSTTTTTSTATTTSTTGTGGSTTGTGGGGGSATPTVIATLAIGSAPYGLFVDADHVFWTNSGTGEVMQAQKDGAGLVTLAKDQGVPYCIVAAGGFAYWISYTGDGILRRAPVGGGEVTDLVSAPAARELVVAGDALFWTREPDDIESAPLTGVPDAGTPVMLLSMNPLANGLAADQDHIYWVNRLDGYVKRATFQLGSEQPLANGDQPWDVVVDATHVFWTERGSAPSVGKVMQASKEDGSGTITLAMAQDGPRGIAVDASHVYWASQEEGTIRRAPIGGGAVELIAKGQGKPVNVALDDVYVYWTSSEGDTVSRITK